MIYNLEAERAELGSILEDPRSILTVIGDLFPSHFYERGNADIYAVMLDMTQRHLPIDRVTLRSELANKEKLAGVGGAEYIESLHANCENVGHYADIIIQAAVKRNLVGVGKDIIGLGSDTTIDADTAQAQAQTALLKVGRARKSGLESVYEIGRKNEARLIHSFEFPNEPIGLATGIKTLDLVLGGLEKKDNIVIAGRPSSGKSALADTIAVNVAKRGKRVALFTLEMSAQQRLNRMVCLMGGYNYDEVRRRRKRLVNGAWREWTPEEFQEYLKTYLETETLPIWIDEKAAIQTNEIEARIGELSLDAPVDLVIVDYLGLAGDAADSKRYDQVGKISRRMKEIAKSADVPILTLAQLNRKCEDRADKKPELADLRDAGDVEQDADVAILIWRAAMYWKTAREWEKVFKHDPYPGERVAELFIAKFKNGATGPINVYFDETQMRFADLEKHP